MPLETEIDWISKKGEGYGREIIGLLIAFVLGLGSIGGAIASNNFGLVILGLGAIIFGGVLMWQGNQTVEKAKHVAWTKEALRDYDRSRSRKRRGNGAKRKPRRVRKPS
jgi:FtsH-binding integral membrane protein